MAIALYCMNLLVPVQVIKAKYPGGWAQCLKDHEAWINGKVWFDEHLFHDGAMDPQAIGNLIKKWSALGFEITEVRDGRTAWKDVCCIEYAGHDWPAWLELTTDGVTAYLAGTEPGERVTPDWLKNIRKQKL